MEVFSEVLPLAKPEDTPSRVKGLVPCRFLGRRPKPPEAKVTLSNSVRVKISVQEITKKGNETHMMRKSFKRFVSGLLTVCMVGSLTTSMYADTSTDGTASKVNGGTVYDSIIDTNKTGSLTIYKYDLTNAEKDGVWDSSYVSTGAYDDYVNATLGKSAHNADEAVRAGDDDSESVLGNGESSYGYAVKGVEFSYLKVADVVQYSENGQVTVLYKIDKEDGKALLDAICIGYDDQFDYITSSETIDSDYYYFESDTLVDALSGALLTNATAVKNALEDYMKDQMTVTNAGDEMFGDLTSTASDHDKQVVGGIMPQTDAYGYTSVDDLELGLYLVVETKVPEMVVNTTNPFFVAVPMTTVNGGNADATDYNTDHDYSVVGENGGKEWLYDITLYPKNQTGNPTLEKTLRELAADGGANDGSDSITDGYSHTTTASSGDIIEYQIISTLPSITSKSTYLSQYNFKDILSAGLTYNKYSNADNGFAISGMDIDWSSTDAATEKAALDSAKAALASAKSDYEAKKTAYENASDALTAAKEAAVKAAEDLVAATETNTEAVAAFNAATTANTSAQAALTSAQSAFDSAETAYESAKEAKEAAYEAYQKAPTDTTKSAAYDKALAAYNTAYSTYVQATKTLEDATEKADAAAADLASATAEKTAAAEALTAATTADTNAKAAQTSAQSTFDSAKSAYETAKETYEAADAACESAFVAYVTKAMESSISSSEEIIAEVEDAETGAVEDLYEAMNEAYSAYEIAKEAYESYEESYVEGTSSASTLNTLAALFMECEKAWSEAVTAYNAMLSKVVSAGVELTFYTDTACENKLFTWYQNTVNEDGDVYFTVTYTKNDDGSTTMDITITDAGLAVINSYEGVYGKDSVNSGLSGCTLRITYSATLDSDETVVYGDGDSNYTPNGDTNGGSDTTEKVEKAGNTNDVSLTWSRTSEYENGKYYFDILIDDAHVYTYGINLTKQFSDNNGNFANVQFMLHNDSDGTYVIAKLADDGVYYVTGHTTNEADATRFVPVTTASGTVADEASTTQGKIVIKGLEADTFTLTEVQTDNGYTLLADDIVIVISTTETVEDCGIYAEDILGLVQNDERYSRKTIYMVAAQKVDEIIADFAADIQNISTHDETDTSAKTKAKVSLLTKYFVGLTDEERVEFYFNYLLDTAKASLLDKTYSWSWGNVNTDAFSKEWWDGLTGDEKIAVWNANGETAGSATFYNYSDGYKALYGTETAATYISSYYNSLTNTEKVAEADAWFNYSGTNRQNVCSASDAAGMSEEDKLDAVLEAMIATITSESTTKYTYWDYVYGKNEAATTEMNTITAEVSESVAQSDATTWFAGLTDAQKVAIVDGTYTVESGVEVPTDETMDLRIYIWLHSLTNAFDQYTKASTNNYAALFTVLYDLGCLDEFIENTSLSNVKSRIAAAKESNSDAKSLLNEASYYYIGSGEATNLGSDEARIDALLTFLDTQTSLENLLNVTLVNGGAAVVGGYDIVVGVLYDLGALADYWTNIPQAILGHKLLTASATVDGKAVSMTSDDNTGIVSANAEVTLTIVNTKGFTLPKTGEWGTWILTIGGTLAAVLAIFFIVTLLKRKKEEEEGVQA